MMGGVFLLGIIQTCLGSLGTGGGHCLTSRVLVFCVQLFLAGRVIVRVGSVPWRHWGLRVQWGVGCRLSILLPS